LRKKFKFLKNFFRGCGFALKLGMNYHTKRRKRRREELKSSLIEYKGSCCSICGYDRCINALSFHHMDPKEKDFTIGEYTRKGYPDITKLYEEIDKCILVCMNCHAEIHSGLHFEEKV